jgi:serine/threonine protein kinase
MSPEYAVHGQYSIKSDVFSFGVLILEIVSGKKNRGFCLPEHDLNLLGHVSMKNSIVLIYVVKQNF